MGYRRGYQRKDGTYVKGHWVNNGWRKTSGNGCIFLFSIIGFLFMLMPLVVFGQQSIKTLTFDNANDYAFFTKVKNNTLIKEYISSHGLKIKAGDTLILGDPISNSSNTYKGAGFNIAKTQTTSTFQFILFGKPSSFFNLMSQSNGNAPNKPDVSYSGEKVLVKQIKAVHKGSRKKPLVAMLLIGEINGRAFGAYKHLTVNDAEQALNRGEIKLLNHPMSKSEAIVKLKESKELLDLGLITKKEFDELKTKLTPIIMSNTTQEK